MPTTRSVCVTGCCRVSGNVDRGGIVLKEPEISYSGIQAYEYARLVKPGGTVGLNEEPWFQYLQNPEFRAYTRSRSRLPRSIFDYLGYALFVGRK